MSCHHVYSVLLCAVLCSYPSLPTSRTYIIKLVNTMPPSSVFANGVSVAYSRYGTDGNTAWTYDGRLIMLCCQRLHGVLLMTLTCCGQARH